MNQVTLPLMGVVISTVDINRVKIPEEAQNRLLRRWLADRDVQIAESEKLRSLVQGEAETTRFRLKEATRAESQTRMMEAITEGIRQVRIDGGDARELIAMSFIQALQKMAEDPATKMFFPSDMRLADLQGLTGAPSGTLDHIGGPNGPVPGAPDNPTGRE